MRWPEPKAIIPPDCRQRSRGVIHNDKGPPHFATALFYLWADQITLDQIASGTGELTRSGPLIVNGGSNPQIGLPFRSSLLD